MKEFAEAFNQKMQAITLFLRNILIETLKSGQLKSEHLKKLDLVKYIYKILASKACYFSIKWDMAYDRDIA